MSVRESLELNLQLLENISRSIIKIYNPREVQRLTLKARESFEEIEIFLLIHEDSLKSTTLDYFLRESKRVWSAVKLHNQLITTRTKMPSPTIPFDIKTATAIVTTYDGSPTDLSAFIDSANLLKELTPPEHTALTIKFLRTRLTGKARLALPENFGTVDELIENVKSRCTSTVTPDNISTKLKATKQTGDLDQFCNEIDTLCNQLHASYIESGVPENVAKRMATKAGVEALTAGVGDRDTKIILKAGTHADVKQAIQKVLENASNLPNAQLLPINGRYKNQHKFRGSGRNYGYNNSNNFNRNHLNFNSNHLSRNNSDRQYYNRSYNNRGRRGNFVQQNRYNQYNQRNARVYYAQPTPEDLGQSTNMGNVMQYQQPASPPRFQNQSNQSSHPLVNTLGQFSQ